MTYEDALTLVGEMSEAEKNCIQTNVLTPANMEYDKSKYTCFLVLELDAETDRPTDNIYWIMAPESTLDETYKIGEKARFDLSDKVLSVQILEVSKWDLSKWGLNKK